MRLTSTTTLVATLLFTGAALVGTGAAPAVAQDAAPAEPAKEKIRLRVAAKKGDKILFVQTQNQSGSAMGMEMGQSGTSDLTWTCATADTSGATEWDVGFGRVHGKITNPMLGEIAFDTANPAAPQDEMTAAMLKPLTALANQTIKVSLGTGGQIAKVAGVKAIADAIGVSGDESGAEESEDGEDGESGEMNALGALLTDDVVAQTMGMTMPALPETGAAIGESWNGKISFSVGPGESFDLAYTNTVEKATADEVHVATKLSFDFKSFVREAAKATAAAEGREVMKEELEELEKALSQMSIDLSGGGKARFSRKDGLLLDSTMKLDMKMSMGEEMGGMAIEQATTTSMKRVDAFEKAPVTATPKAEPVAPAEPAAPPAPANK